MAEHESIIYELQVRGAGAAGSAVDALNRRFATLGQNLRMTSQAAAQAAAGSRLPFFQKSGRTMVGGISHLPSFIKAIYKDAGANGIERSHRIGFASASDALAARNKLRGANKNRVGAQIAHYMTDSGSSQMWSAMSDPYQAERDARGKHLSEEHIKALRILNRAQREESLRERQSESERRRIAGVDETKQVDGNSASDALAARNKLRGANKNRVGAQIAHYMMDRGSSRMWSAMSDPYQDERDARGKHLSEEHIRALRILNRERREQGIRERRSEKDINRMKYEGTTAIVPYVDKVAEAEAKARKEKEFAESQARWAAKRREILMEAKQRRKDILLSLGKWAAGPKMSRFLTAAGLGNNLAAVSGAVGLRALKWMMFDNPSNVFARDMKTYVSASRAGVSAGEASALGWASRVYGGDAKSASALLGNLVGDVQGALVGRGLGRLGDAALRYGLDITGSGMGGLATRKELLPRIANLLAEMNDQQKKGLADTLGLQEAEFMLLKDGWDNAKLRIDEANRNNPFNDPVYIKTMEEFQQSKTDLQTQWDKTTAEWAKSYGGWGTGFMNLGKKGLEWLSYIPKADAWLTDKTFYGLNTSYDATKNFFGNTLPTWASDGSAWVDKKVGDMFPEGWGAAPDTYTEHLRFPDATHGSYYNAPSMTITPTFNNTFNVSGNLDSSVVPEIGDSFKGEVMPNLGSRFLRYIPQTNLASPVR